MDYIHEDHVRPYGIPRLRSAIESELAPSARPSILGSSLNVATTPPINEQRRADDRTQTGYWAVCLQWAELITVLDRNTPSI